MRKIAAGSIALVVLLFGAQFALAASDPVYLTPPTNFSCAFTQTVDPDDTITCTWDNNLGAPKYSVSTVANYDLNPTGTLSVDLSFGTTAEVGPTTSIDIPLSAFPTDPDVDTDTDTLTSVILRVKGLAPQRHKSSNNQFTGTWTCTVGGTCAVTP